MAEVERNLEVEAFLGWEETTGGDTRLSYTPEDGSRNLYSSWEEFLGPTSPWTKYFESPGEVFDREHQGHLPKRGRKRLKFLAAQDTLRQRKTRGIVGSERVFCNIKAERKPLSPGAVFEFAQPNGKRVGIELGHILAIISPSKERSLAIANASRIAPGGGLQLLADLLGKPIFAANNAINKKRFEHAYFPRIPASNEGV